MTCSFDETQVVSGSFFKNHRWLPESARWLISNGKVNRAHFYLSKCAKLNGREQFMADLKPEVKTFKTRSCEKLIFTSILSSFLLAPQVLSKVIIVENENRRYSHLDLVRTPMMRRLALLTGIVWYKHFCALAFIQLRCPLKCIKACNQCNSPSLCHSLKLSVTSFKKWANSFNTAPLCVCIIIHLTVFLN